MKNGSWSPGDASDAGWLHSEMTDVFQGASILLVEDDGDIRELLVTLLELAGFVPTACNSAEQGLEQLREQPFDLVLTDYALPNRTGGWLLQQASEEGLLDATPALVVTAYPNPPDVKGFEIIQKPFDLDDLVRHVQRHLAGGGPVRPRAGSRRADGSGRGTSGEGPSGNGDNNDDNPDCPDPIELILYVSAHSPRSAAAVENIRRALKGYKSRRVTLTVYDLSQEPNKGAGDGVAFTPTPVKKSPSPRTFILGHISSQQLLLDLLDGCD